MTVALTSNMHHIECTLETSVIEHIEYNCIFLPFMMIEGLKQTKIGRNMLPE
jgi:hypothetical protein